MLTASQIRRQIADGAIGWSGDLRGDGLLLRLGATMQPFNRDSADRVIDLTDQEAIDSLYEEPVTDWGSTALEASGLLLVDVADALTMNSEFYGIIAGFSHLARVGLGVHVTSPLVYPGWRGTITLELVNFAPIALLLRQGMPVARLMIGRFDIPSLAAVPHVYYGGSRHLGSKYAADHYGNLGNVDGSV